MVRLLLTLILLVVIFIPEELFKVRLLKILAVLPDIVCAEEPTNFTPAEADVELSVNVPLLVKLPDILSDAVAEAAIVRVVAGKVLLIVRLLLTAAVPA